MTKEHIKELKQIREKLIEIRNVWHQDVIDKRTALLNKLFDIIENQNFNEFLNLRFNDYYYLNCYELKEIINKYTNWLTNKEAVKQSVVSGNDFYKIVNIDVLNDVSMWIEILKENDYGFVDKLNLDSDHRFNFNIALQNKELLDLSFNKLKKLNSLFHHFDFTKLDQKYFNDIKYIRLILNITHRPEDIKLINKDLLFKDKDLWKSNCGDIVIYVYGAEIVKYVDKSLWLDKNYLRKLIDKDINIFIDYYDDIIKDKDLIEAAINANYKVIKHIKNNDFNDEIKEIIVNKLNSLEDEIYD